MSNYSIKRRPSRKNFGLAKTMKCAARVALNLLYSGGNRGTRYTHYVRFRLFVVYVKNNFYVTDARRITSEHFHSYSQHISDMVRLGLMKISYAQNLISSVNVVLSAFGLSIWLSPEKYCGRRSLIRVNPPAVADSQINTAVEDLCSVGNKRAAAVLLLCREFALRVREACLADLDSWLLQIEECGRIAVLDGCKGGRKCLDRTIDVGISQQDAIDFAISVRPPGSKNLIAQGETLSEFNRGVIYPARSFLKKNGILNFRELRAVALCEIFERAAGIPAPVFWRGREKYPEHLVIIGYEAVARAAGHYRLDTSRSYTG